MKCGNDIRFITVSTARNSNLVIQDLECTTDISVTYSNISVRAFGKVVSVHGILRTANILTGGKLAYIHSELLPAYLVQFCYATPEGVAGTGYVDIDGAMVFNTLNLSDGTHDLYVGFSYVAK